MSSSRKTRTKLVTVKPVPVVVAKVPTPRRARRRRALNTPSNSPNRVPSVLGQYRDALNDPFDVAPPKLGFGTFLETQLVTAYVHGVSSANADGSISYILNVSPTSLLYVNNSGLTGTTWNGSSASNLNAINADGYVARVVSGGLRVCPLIAQNATPGLVFGATNTGVRPNLATTDSTINTATLISQFPSAHIGLATYGCTGLLRPVDENCIETFPVGTATGPVNAGGTALWAYPMIAFHSLPPGCQVAYEAVLNLELIPTGTSSQADGTYNRTSDRGLSAFFPSFSSMFNSVASSLSDPIHLDFNEGGPSTTRLLPRSSMFGSRNARRARGGTTAGSHAFNMSFLASDIQKNQERQNVRVEPEESYVDLGTRYIRETVVPTALNVATGSVIGGIGVANIIGQRRFAG